MADAPMRRRLSGGVREARRHDSAEKHVSGEARYIDDLPEPRDLLHIYVARSPHAHAYASSSASSHRGGVGAGRG